MIDRRKIKHVVIVEKFEGNDTVYFVKLTKRSGTKKLLTRAMLDPIVDSIMEGAFDDLDDAVPHVMQVFPRADIEIQRAKR